MTANEPPTSAARVEAVLFVSPNPVPADALREATGLSAAGLEAALGELEARYSAASSGVVIRRVGGGFQLATNPACAAAVERFREELRPPPVSTAALEVLSCVLYLGPTTRGGVSAVRGVNSDAVVRTLLDRGLLAEAGAADSPGNPALLDVTPDFLAAAGARNRGDFPPLESLVSAEDLARVRERLNLPVPAPEDP